MRAVLLLVALVAATASAATWEERVCAWYESSAADAFLASQLPGGRASLANGECVAVAQADQDLLNGDSGLCKVSPVSDERYSLPMGLAAGDSLTAATLLNQGIGLLGAMTAECAAELPGFSCPGAFAKCVTCSSGLVVPAFVSREKCLTFGTKCSASVEGNGILALVWGSISPDGEDVFRAACETFPPTCASFPENDIECDGGVVESGKLKITVVSDAPTGVDAIAVKKPTIECTGAGSFTERGKRTGLLTMRSLAAGSYQCSVTARGYDSGVFVADVGADATTSVTAVLVPEAIKFKFTAVDGDGNAFLNSKARFTCVPVGGIASANFAINAIENERLSGRGRRTVRGRAPGVYECTWRCRDGSCESGPAGTEPFVIDASLPGKTYKSTLVFN